MKLVGDNPTGADDRVSLGYLCQNLSVVLGPDEMAARECYTRQAVRLWEQLASDFPNVRENQNCLSSNYDILADLLSDQGLREQADQARRRALEIRERMVQRDPDVPVYRSALGATLNNLALDLTARGEVAEARRLLDRAIQQQRIALGTNPANPVCRQFLRNHHAARTHVLIGLGAHKEAALAAAELPRFSPLQWQDHILAAQILATCFSATDADARIPLPEREAEARSYANQAEILLRDLPGLIGDEPEGLKRLATMLANCEVVRFRDPARAVGLATKATELLPNDPASWSTLGLAHHRAGNLKDAIDALKKSMQLGSSGNVSDSFLLAMAYWRNNEKDQARQWYGRAIETMEKDHSEDDELRRFHAEASALLGLTDHPTRSGKKEENTPPQSKP